MECSLCGLPTPEPPIRPEGPAERADTAPGPGYCCRGCLEVSRHLDDLDAETGDQPAGETAADGFLEGGSVSAATEGAVENAGEPETEAFFAVDGMHCGTCERFLELRATDHEAVTEARASYPSGTVRLAYDDERAEESDLAAFLAGSGYDASPIDEHEGFENDESGRLLVGAFFGMMTMVWYVLFLYPAYLGVSGETLLFDPNSAAGRYLLANIWVMATIVLGYTGYPILRGAAVSLRTRHPNMDLLVGLAATTAYVYSTIAGLLGHVEVYFDITVVIILVVTIGTAYKRRIARQAAGSLADLTEERVDAARRRTDDGTETVAVDTLSPGEEVVVRSGERIPTDGTVTEGSGAVDESLVTGEALPERREPGEAVVGGALVTDGGLVVAVDGPEQRTLERVRRRLWAIQSATPGVQRLADRIALVFVPLVLVLAGVATAAHLVGGAAPEVALLTGLAVLIVSCPCALGLATPLSVATATREALGNGIAVLDETVFERATEVDVVALDKTGTVTTGRMAVGSVTGPDQTLAYASALEQFAEHPVADAVVEAGDHRDMTVSDVEQVPGRGVVGKVEGTAVLVGHRSLFASRDWSIPDRLESGAASARSDGRIPALVGWDGTAKGLIVATDAEREDWDDVATTLARDHEVILITGDESRAADAFRQHEAVDEVFAGVPPEGKAELVRRLQQRGRVAMVGDGTNDAPALATADLGIAMGTGTACAADAADVVITDADIGRVPGLLSLLRRARQRVRQNLGWAFCYNAIAIPVAALGLLNPLLAAIAMGASSLLVVGNASRSLVRA